MRRPGCCGVHHLPIRPARPQAAAGFPWGPGRPALHGASTQGGARTQVPQSSSGGSAPRWPGGERHRGCWRPSRSRHGHLGAHQRRSPPTAGFRPGRTGRSPCGPPTRGPMPSAPRTVGCVGHPDGAIAHRATPRARVRRPPRSRRASGDRGRRCRHHRRDTARCGGCTSPCRRRRTGPVCRCLHARRIRSFGPAPPGARGPESHPRGMNRPIASHG